MRDLPYDVSRTIDPTPCVTPRLTRSRCAKPSACCVPPYPTRKAKGDAERTRSSQLGVAA